MVIVRSINSGSGDMEWSADGENTDYSTSSSPPAGRRLQQSQDQDSLSDEDDLSDEFSLVDSDEERKTDGRYSVHQLLQVGRDRLFEEGKMTGNDVTSRFTGLSINENVRL